MLASISPYRPSARAQLLSGAQTVNTTGFNYCAFLLRQGSARDRAGQALDRRCESGLAAFTTVKQEVSQICSM
jgi:hypothetical protein